MSFPRYPKYKASGVEWLGEVPEHWSTPPLYLRYEAVLGKMLDEKRYRGTHSLPYVRNIDVQWDRVNVQDLPEMDILPDELERFTLRSGDLLVCEGGEVGRTAIWRSELDTCAFQKAIHRLRPQKDTEDVRYFFYCMQYGVSTGVFIAEGNANTIPHLTGEKLRRYRFPTPPLSEQTCIAAFLDRETAKIDALIAEQQRLIELLQEKRQAVICHAVTKGLNPDAPMKDSGIEWLGEVPEHWTILPSRRLFGQRNESAKATDKQVTASQKYGIVFQTDFVEMEGRRVVETITGTHTLRRVHPNDFVISLRSFQGGIEWCRIQGSITFHYVVLTPLKCVYEPFFAHLFKSDAYIQALRSTTNLIRDGQDLRYLHFVQVPLPVVPLEEQQEIAAYLDTSVAQFDVLASEASNLITLLQERRSALISAAVTGQIDVRGLAGSEAA